MSKLIVSGQLYWSVDDGVLMLESEVLAPLIAQHFNVTPNDAGYYWLTDPQHPVRITIELLSDPDMVIGAGL